MGKILIFHPNCVIGASDSEAPQAGVGATGGALGGGYVLGNLK